MVCFRVYCGVFVGCRWVVGCMGMVVYVCCRMFLVGWVVVWVWVEVLWDGGLFYGFEFGFWYFLMLGFWVVLVVVMVVIIC